MAGRARWVLAFAGAAAVVFAGGQLVARRLVHPSARVARAALAVGRYADADRALADWLRSEPVSAEAHVLKARVAIALDAPKDVVESEYRRARECGAAEPELALVRAIGSVKFGRFAEAEPILRQVFDANRGPDPQVCQALARIYIETFDIRRASPVLDRWAHEAPDDPKPYLWRIEVDRRNDNPAETVIQDYRAVLARDPTLAQARRGLAEALREHHRNEDARAEYEAYLRLQPDDSAAHLGAGRNARELGDEEEAIRHFERALALEPRSAAAHRELAGTAERRGDHTGALAHIDRAVALDPFDLDARHVRGLILARLGRTEEAERERAVAKKLRDELVELQALKGRLIQRPNDPDTESRIARWMFDHGHDDDGVRWAEKVLRGYPGHEEANRLLGAFHMRAGHPGRANYYRLNAATNR